MTPTEGLFPVPPNWLLYAADQIKAKEPSSCAAGPFGSKIASKYFVDDGVPIIRGGNLRDDLTRFVPEGFAFVSEDRAREYGPQHVKPGDLVFTCWGTIGQVGLIPENGPYPEYIISNKQLKLRVDRSLADPLFCFYYFASPAGVQYIRNRGIGGAVPGINLGILKAMPIALPRLDVQKRIVDVLSAYDDLIENNRRRMALLEESARLLYQEWFVRLRFPGHEHTEVVDGVPKGWENYSLDDLCVIARGASPRPIAAFTGGEIPWFKIGDATASESMFIFETKERVTEEGARKSVTLEPGSLILSNSATCGIPYFTAVRGCVHDGWLHFSRYRKISEQFLYCYLYFKREELVNSVGDGCTQKNLNTAAVGRLRLSLPKQDTLVVQFQDAVRPLFEMVLNLARQNNSLRATRDLLLPHLMSGEIAV